MKHYITIFLVLSAIVVLGNDRVHKMEQAQSAYEAGKYNDAIAYYEEVASQGYTNFELYYNLGNAYFKNNRIPKALLNYERAKKINPTDEDLLFNIELANTFLADKFESLPTLDISTFFKRLVLSLSPNSWAVFSIITFISGLVFFILYHFKESLKKLSLIFIPIVLSLSILSFVFGAMAKQYIFAQTTAIIMTPSLTVQSVPGSTGSDLYVIHSGLKVNILDTQKDWIRIKLPDGNVGWVKKVEVEVI